MSLAEIAPISTPQPNLVDPRSNKLWVPEKYSNLPIPSYVAEGPLYEGVNIEAELEAGMAEYGGELLYWQPGAEVGEKRGYSREYMMRKLGVVVEALKGRGVEVDPADIEGTEDFLTGIFDVYEGEKDPYITGSSAAFVATTRIKRLAENEFTPMDFRRETLGCWPILRYLDASSAQKTMVGQPPFALDVLGSLDKGNDPKRTNQVVFTGLYLDLLSDIGDIETALYVAKNVAQETSDFLQNRLDIRTLGLAALLPKSTEYGKWYQRPGMITHTGHPDTTHMLAETGIKAMKEGIVDLDRKHHTGVPIEHVSGVVGVGGIGLALAEYKLLTDPDHVVGINDFNEQRMREVARYLRETYGHDRVEELPTLGEALIYGGVAYVAISHASDLDKEPALTSRKSFEGIAVADDTQPTAVSGRQVRERGGQSLAVVGADYSLNGLATSNGFDFGGNGSYYRNGSFACATGVAALGQLPREEQQRLAVDRPSNGRDAVAAREYMIQQGLGESAPLQTVVDGRAQLVS